MIFRTEYQAKRSDLTLHPDTPVMLTGSCFSDNISERMRRSLWHAVNPLGTLYNPLSISEALRVTLIYPQGEKNFADSLFRHDGKWHSWLFDSRMSAGSKHDCAENFNRLKENTRRLFSDCDTLIATFGTAYCYYLAGEKEEAVANCHKMPSEIFTRRRLSIDEIVKEWDSLIPILRKLNPKLSIIFTVSPVRHLKDGMVENMRSKSILLLATERLSAEYDFCHYFPAFEILNDDLRDYRFYASDLVHPSADAVEYIWEKFRATFLDSSGEALLKEGEKMTRRISHRPLIATPEEREKIRLENLRVLEDFLSRHPLMHNPF